MPLRFVEYTAPLQAAVDAFYRDCFAAMHWHYDPAGFHADVFDIERVYQSTGCFTCLMDGDALIGTVAVRCIDAANKIAELKRLYLLESVRGKGYGQLLLDHALSVARARGYALMRLDTVKSRTAARKLFERNGFKPIERYNDNPRAELFYERAL